VWQNFTQKYSSIEEALKKSMSLENLNIIDTVGDEVLKFKQLKLDETLAVPLDQDFVKRTIEKQENFNGIAPLVAVYSDSFIKINEEYFNDLKKVGLEFIASILKKYPSLTIVKQADLKREYPQLDFSQEKTFENPDGESELSLEEKLKYGLNPTNPHNLDEILNDKNVIDYVKLKGKEVGQAKQLLQELQNKYGEKLTRAMKELVREGKIKIEEMEEQGTIAKTQVEELFNNKFRREENTLEEFIDNEFTQEEMKYLIMLNKDQESIMNPALTKAITYSQEENFIQQEKEFIDLIREFPETNDGFKQIKEYNLFKPIFMQVGEKWKYAFELYKQLKQAGIELKDTETKLRFYSYIQSRGPLYEAMKGKEKAQKYLAEVTAQNLKNWQERIRFIRENNGTLIKKGFPDLGVLTNNITIAYMNKFKRGSKFRKPQEMTEEELIQIINDLWNPEVEKEEGMKLLQFEKENAGKEYPKFPFAKTSFPFDPADVDIPLDPYGFIGQKDWKTHPYWGIFGQKTIMKDPAQNLTNTNSLKELSRVFLAGNNIKESEMIKLGSDWRKVLTNEVSLLRTMGWLSDIPNVEHLVIDLDNKKYSLVEFLNERKYIYSLDLVLMKLKTRKPSKTYQHTKKAIYFNPYLLNSDDVLNYEVSGISEEHQKGDPYIYRNSELILDKLP